MKKILAFLLAVTLLGLTACSSGVVHQADLDETKPWETSSKYEKSVFTVERYKMKRSGKNTVTDGDPIAVGTYVTEIEILPATADSDSRDTQTKVKNSFTLTYADDERAGANRGLTDTIESECVFSTIGAIPAWSYRKATLAPREGESRNDSHTIFANYKTSETDINGTTVAGMTSQISWHDTQSTLTISTSGQVFDNEQLYYMLRAFKNTAAEGSETFQLSNLFDAHNAGSYSVYNMSLSIAEEKETLFVDESFTQFSTQSQNDKGETLESIASDGNGHAKVECIKGSVGINATNSGPADTVYFSNVPFRIDDNNKTNKVIMKIIRKQYSGAEETYNILYTLQSYTTTKA